jgi:hypothetical protein
VEKQCIGANYLWCCEATWSGVFGVTTTQQLNRPKQAFSLSAEWPIRNTCAIQPQESRVVPYGMFMASADSDL